MISLVPPPLCFTGQSCCSPPILYLFALLFAVSQLIMFPQHWILICVCGCERCLCVSNGFCPSSSSYGKRLDDPTVTSASTGTSSAGLSRLNSVLAQRYLVLYSLNSLFFSLTLKIWWSHSFFLLKTPSGTDRKEGSACRHHLQLSRHHDHRRTGDQAEAQVSQGIYSVCVDGKESAALCLKVWDLCRSYLTPVRDEEAEAQRKARSRHARQSRRSTQVQTSPAHMSTAGFSVCQTGA